jgi:hypothetical protein
MVAPRAWADFGARRPGVEMAAGDAMKRGLAALALEARMIATVVIKPQAEKYRRDDQAIDHDRGGQGKHGPMLAEIPGRVFEIKRDVVEGQGPLGLGSSTGCAASRPHAPPPCSALLQPIATRTLFRRHALGRAKRRIAGGFSSKAGSCGGARRPDALTNTPGGLRQGFRCPHRTKAAHHGLATTTSAQPRRREAAFHF